MSTSAEEVSIQAVSPALSAAGREEGGVAAEAGAEVVAEFGACEASWANVGPASARNTNAPAPRRRSVFINSLLKRARTTTIPGCGSSNFSELPRTTSRWASPRVETRDEIAILPAGLNSAGRSRLSGGEKCPQSRLVRSVSAVHEAGN